MLELIDARDQMTPVHIARPRLPAGDQGPAAAAPAIVEDVRLRGDAAVLEHAERWDGARVAVDHLRVSPDEVHRSRGLVRPELLDALEVMSERLRSTCERQLPASWENERSGETIGELVRPLRRVGVLAGPGPGYASSVVMAAVPARVAGVEGLAVAAPPGGSGGVSETVLAACSVCGIDEVYRISGPQAVAALAYGTESVRPVEKIVGPGDARVAHAKRAVAGWVGTDEQSGVGELAVVADEGADGRLVAADLVAHAELGPQGLHVLVTWAPELVDRVVQALDLELAAHPRFDDVENALIEGGRAVLVRDADHAFDTVNALAPAAVELAVDQPRAALQRIHNAGAVFVGLYTPAAIGRHVAGTNQVLPAGGAARWASGLSVHDFVKRIYVCDLDSGALDRLGPHTESLADAEGLSGHERAVRLRIGEPWERGTL